jgi:two-component sensor histidine kinase
MVAPVPNEHGPVERLIVISRDITAQQAAHQRQAELAAELGHRINNTLTVVMASQTRRAATDMNSFYTAFAARLKAMSEATAAIVEGQWDGAYVRALAETQLKTFLTSADHRITLDGADILVPTQHAQTLALIINELATNATKYGALSNKTGEVMLTWALADDGQTLRLEWREHGGPPVTPPTRTGSGSALLSNAAGANVDLRFEPNGVVCLMTLDV